MNKIIAADDDVIRPIVLVGVINELSGKQTFTFAMLDSGADRDVISEDLVQRLGLEQRSKTMTVQTVETKVTQRRHLTHFRLESKDGAYSASIDDALVAQVWSGENDIPPAKRDLSAFPHLRGIVFEDADAKVELILGVAHAETWLGAEVRRGTRRQAFAILTSFGWTLIGACGKRSSSHIA